MERVPEPELMDDAAQAAAYACADFEEPHARYIELFHETFPDEAITGTVLDLGCGPADITIRFARAHPDCAVHGVDGAEAMLAHGRDRLKREGLAERVRLIHGYLPGVALPLSKYDAVISNSLLHHLRDPMVLWNAVKDHAKPAAPVFVMDLLRPFRVEDARSLMEQYAAGEPEVLRRDFFHSLCAAYRVDEIEAQLAAAGLPSLQARVVSDRHLIVSGFMPRR